MSKSTLQNLVAKIVPESHSLRERHTSKAQIRLRKLQKLCAMNDTFFVEAPIHVRHRNHLQNFAPAVTFPH